MYATYNKQPVSNGFRFTRHDVISLFGRHAGFIPWLLKFSLAKPESEPFAWHLEIASVLRRPEADYPAANSIVVDLRPGNKDVLSLCELTDVWGYSPDGWTPMMWRMTELHWDVDSTGVNKLDFEAPSDGTEIHSFIHAAGSMKNGEPVGTWNTPNASPTNSALLWPKALEYFLGRLRNRKSSRAK